MGKSSRTSTSWDTEYSRNLYKQNDALTELYTIVPFLENILENRAEVYFYMHSEASF